ncbi:hypothetical protein DQ04_08381030, partial [Trypanosoma grayi]|uniref:hypothetical protein n=1 Tax=Trypanosoma grayi TaxID=71804 RepID=UPI0004F4328E
ATGIEDAVKTGLESQLRVTRLHRLQLDGHGTVVLYVRATEDLTKRAGANLLAESEPVAYQHLYAVVIGNHIARYFYGNSCRPPSFPPFFIGALCPELKVMLRFRADSLPPAFFNPKCCLKAYKVKKAEVAEVARRPRRLCGAGREQAKGRECKMQTERVKCGTLACCSIFFFGFLRRVQTECLFVLFIFFFFFVLLLGQLQLPFSFALYFTCTSRH